MKYLQILFLTIGGFKIFFAIMISAQTSGTISGTVSDVNNAVIPNAEVTIKNAVTGFQRTVTTDDQGEFVFEQYSAE